MSDVEKMLKEGHGLPTDQNGVPILGQQQVPMFNGLPVNGRIMSLDELCSLTDRQFRELFIAAVVSLSGGIYVPTSAAPAEPNADGTGQPEAEAELGGEVIKAGDPVDEVDPED